MRTATGAADPADVVRAERNVGADRGPTHAHGGCGAHVVMQEGEAYAKELREEADAIHARVQEAATMLKEGYKENAELANQMRESIKGVAAEHICPLTLGLLVDPVVAKDGQIYERSHILAWLSRNATSPVTREPMGTELTPVPLIRNSIEKLVSSGAIEGDIAEAWQKASAKKRADETKVKETRAKAEAGDKKLCGCSASGTKVV